LESTKIAMQGLSCIPWPTSFISWTSGMLKVLNCSFGPMPLSSNIWGLPSAPADNITSPLEVELFGFLM
jgi:hypothetical protein